MATISKKKTTSSSKKVTSSKTVTPQTKQQQLATIKSSLEKMSADLKAGKVTGLTPSKTSTVTTKPVVSTPTPTVSKPTTSPVAATPTYSGPSVVDYLSAQGQASDFNSRAKLAATQGIAGYTGTADQNTQLLTKLRLNTSGAVPSTALTDAKTPQDVLDRRAQLEGLQAELKTKQDQLAEMQKFAATEDDPTLSPLADSDKYLSQYFSTDAQRQTQAQKSQADILGKISNETETFYNDRGEVINDAYDKFGVPKKQEALATLQKEMADREVKLRNDVQVLETAPEYRGVSREFAVDQREQIKSKGAFDLANLAIVESAYRGDVEQSKTLAKELIDDQFSAYEGKIETYKTQLAALEPQLNADEKKQALAISVALDERSRILQEKKADTELKYEYAGAVAKAGAPLSVTKSILSAKSADEAFMLAAPYFKSTKTTSGTSSGGTGTRAGISEVVPGVSSYSGSLAQIDLTSSKTSMNTIKNSVREQFAPAFASKLVASLTDEQLRDFLIQYDAAQREAGMNMDPEQVLNAYMQYIGKSSGGEDDSNIDSRINNAV